MPKSSWLLLLLLLIALFGTGYSYQQGQTRQHLLLARFTALDADFTADNERAAQAQSSTVRGISKIVYLNHNWAPDAQVLHLSEQIWNRTKTLTDTLQVFRRQFKFGGKPGRSGSLQVLPTPVSGTDFTTHLHRYQLFIRQLPPTTYPLSWSAPPAWPAQTAAPAVAVATLAALEAQVWEYARQALLAQAERVDSKCFICSRIEARALAASATVAPGATYQAQLFLAETPVAAYGTLSMTANHKLLAVRREAGGEVALPTPPQRPDQPDTVQAQWQGTIRAHSYPADTTWVVTVPYLIVKPTAL